VTCAVSFHFISFRVVSFTKATQSAQVEADDVKCKSKTE